MRLFPQTKTDQKHIQQNGTTKDNLVELSAEVLKYI